VLSLCASAKLTASPYHASMPLDRHPSWRHIQEVI
jgi:hypothetical protein